MSLAFTAERISTVAGAVYYWFRLWRKSGTLDHIRQVLLSSVREQSGRALEPSVGILDTQTVKTAAYTHRALGITVRKKIKGRKGCIVTDTQGLLLAVVILSAKTSENHCGFLVLRRLYECYANIRLVWCVPISKQPLIALALSLWQMALEVVPRRQKKGFLPLKRRWVLERIFAWLSSARRLAKDYECLPQSHQAFVELAIIWLLRLGD